VPREEADAAVQALIQAYVACKLALEALPHLPTDLRDAVTEPIKALCERMEPALDRLQSGAAGSQ
jgi:hypothetical protein